MGPAALHNILQGGIKVSVTDPSGQPAPMGPLEFMSASQPSVVTFNLKNLTPPSNLYVRQEEGISFAVVNSAVAVTSVRINYRMLLTNGQVQVGAVDQAVGNVGNFQFFFLPLTEGYLLSVQAVPNQKALRGQCFVRLGIARNISQTNLDGTTLAQGYIDNHGALGWPGGPQTLHIDGAGAVQTLTQGNPAAGADVNFTFTINQRTRIQSMNVQLVTSAVAGNRVVRAQVKDSVPNLVFQSGPSANIPASTTAQISFQSGGSITTTDATSIQLPLPSPLVLAGGSQILTNTIGLLAGDQFSNIAVLVETWQEP